MQRQSRSRLYTELIDTFGIEKITERSNLLYDNAKDFIRDRKLRDIVYIDEERLDNAIIDYFSDIARLKDFHSIDRVNATKVAAYTSYWLYKRNPLYCPDYSLVKTNSNINYNMVTDINSWFAQMSGISMIFDIGQMDLQNSQALQQFNEFQKTLNYFFTYRLVSPQALELAYLGLLSQPGWKFIGHNGD